MPELAEIIGTFALMPRASGWISRLKKDHDLQIFRRPTCCGILGDGIRKKYYFPTGSIFFEFTKVPNNLGQLNLK